MSATFFRVSHGAIGKSRQHPATAYQHVRYILRPEAATWSSVHVPIGVEPTREGIGRWIARETRTSRKNARLLDKLVLSIPRVLPAAARAQLVEEFAWRVTFGRLPYIAAIHDSVEEGDIGNPHAHIAIIDRAFGSRERVLQTSALGRYATAETVGSTAWFRAQWAACVNETFAELGLGVRVDERSTFARGLTYLRRRNRPRPIWQVRAERQSA